jgi:predicted PurR-regulated permease PerM
MAQHDAPVIMTGNGERPPPANRDRPSPETSVPPVEPVFRERFRLYAFAALTAVLVGLCVLLAIPFLPAITWAVALAIIAWPMHRRIRQRVGWPRLSALLSTATVVVLILGPALFVTYQLMREAGAAAGRVQTDQSPESLRAQIDTVPGLRHLAGWMDQANLDIETEIGKVVASYFQDLTGLIRGSVAALVQFLVVMFLLFFIFLDRSEFLHRLRDLLPLSKSESERVFSRAADSVHANLHASVITSLIDSVGGTLMFWLLGLPSPVLWGVVMFVLCLLPIVGATLVWVPASLFLALSGRWPHAAALVAWGVTTSILVDNFLYSRLAGKRMRMHEAPALIAFLGGLAIFGMSGMILGPAILAITVAFLEVWNNRLSGDAAVAPS